MNYNWPLNDSHFTFLDKLRICKFFLQNNQWTQGEWVKKYEKLWSDYTSSKYTVMTSSGSSSNTLIARRIKDTNFNKNRNEIVTGAVSWHTSFSPWIREGFNVKVLDISLKDFNLDYDLLEDYLSENHERVKCVFLVSLLGFAPDIVKYKRLCDKYGILLLGDFCESSFSRVFVDDIDNFNHICSTVTCSTSTYYGHMTSTIEGGLIFTNDENEYAYYLMARNHGMVRSLENYKNKLRNINPNSIYNNLVDKQFDFNILGDNLRSTNISAFLGCLDFTRKDDYIKRRRYFYELILQNLDLDKFIFPEDEENTWNVPFSFPIVFKKNDINKINKIKEYCNNNRIERRPIVGSNMLRHKCFQHLEDYKKFPNAEHLHQNLYIGLYPNLGEERVFSMIEFLNKI